MTRMNHTHVVHLSQVWVRAEPFSDHGLDVTGRNCIGHRSTVIIDCDLALRELSCAQITKAPAPLPVQTVGFAHDLG